jgi:uncharacterized protein (TIGR02453 family)
MHQKAEQLNCRFMEGAVTPAPLEPTTATLYTPAMITPATFKFLRDLKKHNQRAWFHEHRDRYLAARTEMVGLVEACLTEIAHIEPNILEQDPEDCLFRINRDTRFSKEKTPYKTHFGAFITDRGRKMNRAGYYIHVEPGGCLLAGGLYMPPAPELKAIRAAILADAAPLRRILRQPAFVRQFGKEMPSDRLKTTPRDVPRDHPDADLLRYKSFGVWRNFPDRDVQSGAFVKEAARSFRAMADFVHWLNAALDRKA